MLERFRSGRESLSFFYEGFSDAELFSIFGGRKSLASSKLLDKMGAVVVAQAHRDLKYRL